VALFNDPDSAVREQAAITVYKLGKQDDMYLRRALESTNLTDKGNGSKNSRIL